MANKDVIIFKEENEIYSFYCKYLLNFLIVYLIFQQNTK